MPDHCNHNHPDFEIQEPNMDYRHTTSLYIIDRFRRWFPEARAFIVSYNANDEATRVTMDGMEFVCEAGSDDDEWMFVNKLTGTVVVFPFEPTLDEPEPKPRKHSLEPDPDCVDENGFPVHYGYWLNNCGTGDTDSMGQRVTSARALQIASDVLHAILTGGMHEWSFRDMELAMGAIAGMRAQSGIMGPDAEALGYGEDGIYLTHYSDIAIYG